MKLVPFKNNLCSKYAEKMISIKINNQCNCNCSFCVDRNGYNAQSINVDKIASSAIQLSDYKKVIITGGEPFLNLDEVIELAKILRPYKERIILNTNGSLLSDESVEKLNDLIDELQVSIHHFDESVNAKIFRREIKFSNIKESLEKAKFQTSINSTFNSFISKEDRIVFVEKMTGICKYIGANRLRLTELKKVEKKDFVEAKEFYPKDSPVLRFNSNDLITKGCIYFYEKDGIQVSVKRLCDYGKGENAPAFSCCFISTSGQKKIDVDTSDTFKVIYSDGLITNDWIFNEPHSK